MKISTFLTCAVASLLFAGTADAYGQTRIEVDFQNADTPKVVAEISTATTLKFNNDNATLSLLNPMDPGVVSDNGFSLSSIKSIKFSGPWSGICEKVVLDSPLSLRQNPVAETLYPSFTEGVGKSLRVYSASGSVMLSLPEWDGNPVDVAELPSGLYFLSIYNQTIKFIKK